MWQIPAVPQRNSKEKKTQICHRFVQTTGVGWVKSAGWNTLESFFWFGKLVNGPFRQNTLHLIPSAQTRPFMCHPWFPRSDCPNISVPSIKQDSELYWSPITIIAILNRNVSFLKVSINNFRFLIFQFKGHMIKIIFFSTLNLSSKNSYGKIYKKP